MNKKIPKAGALCTVHSGVTLPIFTKEFNFYLSSGETVVILEQPGNIIFDQTVFGLFKALTKWGVVNFLAMHSSRLDVIA